jgi:hypothetical protein
MVCQEERMAGAASQTQKDRITFAVDDVEPQREPRPVCRAYQAIEALVGSSVESCCDYHGAVLDHIRYHGLLAAVHEAFARHRPLVLYPDAIWITIAQGIAQHMVLHAEELRRNLVQHTDRLKPTVDITGFAKGSPENPWEEAFAGWAGQIREHIGQDVYDALVCDFTTTTPAARTASEIVLMDILERYFHYEAVCICGIPQITLEGSPDDWTRLRQKIEAVQRFGMGWWLQHLRPICDQFVRASQGEVDRTHWQSICKLRKEYGGNVVNGWIARLFPYIRAFDRGPTSKPNPIFQTGEGFSTLYAPSGISRVPFTWRIEAGAAQGVHEMEALGGLLGVEQDEQTLALRPKVGWAVREVSTLTVALNRVEREHHVSPGYREPVDENRSPFEQTWPEDMMEAYHRSNGMELFGNAGEARFRMLPFAQTREVYRDLNGSRERWIRFCDLADGTYLAIDLDCGYDQATKKRLAEAEAQLGAKVAAEERRINEAFTPRPLTAWLPGQQAKLQQRIRKARGESKILLEYEWRMREIRLAGEMSSNAVYHCTSDQVRAPSRSAVVAESFTEFLQRALDSGGRYWWLQ